jgi:nitroreductase
MQGSAVNDPQQRSDDMLTSIKSRRSAGKLHAQRAPTREQIELLLEACTWAPNHKLTNPWRFIVIAGEARKTMGEMYKRLILEDAKDESAETRMRADVAGKKPSRAPVIIMVVCETEDPPRRRKEDYAACGAGVQNMLLLAQSMGLATKWNTGGVVDDPRFKQHFGLAPTAEVVGLINVGYADGTLPSAPPRKAASELTQWQGWPE